jgi:hypothetical protein
VAGGGHEDELGLGEASVGAGSGGLDALNGGLSGGLGCRWTGVHCLHIARGTRSNWTCGAQEVNNRYKMTLFVSWRVYACCGRDPESVSVKGIKHVDKPADKPGYPHKATKGGIELHTFKSPTQRAKHSATETPFALAEGAHQSADASGFFFVKGVKHVHVRSWPTVLSVPAVSGPAKGPLFPYVAGVRCNVVACVPRVTPSSSSWPRIRSLYALYMLLTNSACVLQVVGLT